MEAVYNESTAQRLATDTESLKLYKNTKGFNWEIKILSTDVERLYKLNNDMMIKFGAEEK